METKKANPHQVDAVVMFANDILNSIKEAIKMGNQTDVDPVLMKLMCLRGIKRKCIEIISRT
jgi:hypothetical protein